MRWSSPGESTAARIKLEQETVAVMQRQTRAFLVDVERMAMAPALIASLHDHLTLGAVLVGWGKVVRKAIHPIVRRLAPTFVGDLDEVLRIHPYLAGLYGRMMRSPLPEQAYTSARSVLAEAARNQWDTATIARHMTDALDMNTATVVDQMVKEGTTWDAMVHRIARTEATAAHNWHALEQLAAQGYTGKRWVAHHDEVTRDTHLAADGQTQPLSSAFIVGNETLMVPGDPQGSPAVTYNCRCVIVGTGEGGDPLDYMYGTGKYDYPQIENDSPDDDEGVPLTASFDPSQPRDSKGRWATTMSFETFDQLTELQDSNMSEEALQARAGYTYMGYRPINEGLRTGTLDPAFQEDVDGLDRGFEESPGLPETTLLYRGFHDFDPPEAFTDNAYVSTSIDPRFAKGFIGGQNITIIAPKGTPFLIGTTDSEREVILPRGGHFIRRSPGVYEWSPP